MRLNLGAGTSPVASGVPYCRCRERTEANRVVRDAESQGGRGRTRARSADFGGVGSAIAHMGIGSSCHRTQRSIKAGAVC